LFILRLYFIYIYFLPSVLLTGLIPLKFAIKGARLSYLEGFLQSILVALWSSTYHQSVALLTWIRVIGRLEEAVPLMAV
jgi:hypothetical protein